MHGNIGVQLDLLQFCSSDFIVSERANENKDKCVCTNTSNNWNSNTHL